MNYAYNSVLSRMYKISFNSLDVIYAFSNLRSIKSEIESRTRTFLNRCERIDNAIVRHMFLVSRVFLCVFYLLCFYLLSCI